MNRRSFIAALLASAATGAATPVPAQPVAVFDWWRDTGPRQAQIAVAKARRDAEFWALNGVYGKLGMASVLAHQENLRCSPAHVYAIIQSSQGVRAGMIHAMVPV